MKVEVTGPAEFQGGVLGGLSKRHAVVNNQDAHEGWFTIECEVRFKTLTSWRKLLILYIWCRKLLL